MAKNQQTAAQSAEQTAEQLPIGAQPTEQTQTTPTSAEQTPPQSAGDVKLILPFTAIVKPGEYTDDDKVKHEYVGIELVNPFPNVELDGVRLNCKWKSDKGVFDFKARQLLKTADDFTINGYAKPNTFLSKRLKRKVTNLVFFIFNPFFAGEIEFTVKDEGQYAVLALLLSEQWGVKLSRYSDNPELAVDNIPSGTSLKNV